MFPKTASFSSVMPLQPAMKMKRTPLLRLFVMFIQQSLKEQKYTTEFFMISNISVAVHTSQSISTIYKYS